MNMFSYVITHDSGFAPNPFQGFLTLATCKPLVRKTAKVGDVLVGTGSASIVGNNRLVYAGFISEVVPLKKYGTDPRFSSKRPMVKGEWFNRHGDNIYEPTDDGWKQRRNPHHVAHDAERDLSGVNVLICEEFWYFGGDAVEIPPQLLGIVKKGPGHKRIEDQNLVQESLQWLRGHEQGVSGRPQMETD